MSGKGDGTSAPRAFTPGETVLRFEGSRVLPEPGPHTLQIGPAAHLLVEGPSRLVNHSCDPNCGFGGERVLVARRAIAQGEEICFDYAMSEAGERVLLPRCLCGSPRCRGEVRGYASLTPALRAEYAPHLAPHLRSA